MPARASLGQSIKDEAGRLGFFLAGFTTPDPPPHVAAFEEWLDAGRHAGMAYLEQRRAQRTDPRLIMPGCRSILALAAPYAAARTEHVPPVQKGPQATKGSIAAYAWGRDYHIVFRERLAALAEFIERHAGRPVAAQWYVDTGPILERDLAQRAGLGWIGKNTCLINPRRGSFFLLAEMLLDLELEPDAAFTSDHCGKCTRCLTACPTGCFLPNRTMDSGRCLSYLTIELKEEIPTDLRPLVRDWVFGCDICQAVCPWNRFASAEGDPAFADQQATHEPDLLEEVRLTAQEFNQRFKDSPVRRAKRRGYLRNIATVLGNQGGVEALLPLEEAGRDLEPLVREHAAWAIQQIKIRVNTHAATADRHQQRG